MTELLRRIISERRAKALLAGQSRLGQKRINNLREAMTWFEKAEAMRPPGNDDALLRLECLRVAFIMCQQTFRPPQDKIDCNPS